MVIGHYPERHYPEGHYPELDTIQNGYYFYKWCNFDKVQTMQVLSVVIFVDSSIDVKNIVLRLLSSVHTTTDYME